MEDATRLDKMHRYAPYDKENLDSYDSDERQEYDGPDHEITSGPTDENLAEMHDETAKYHAYLLEALDMESDNDTPASTVGTPSVTSNASDSTWTYSYVL